MKKILIALLITIQSMAASIGQDESSFAFDLYSKLDRNQNLVFSPYCIFSNLSLLFFGAEDFTGSQIKNALHLSATDKQFLDAVNRYRKGLTRIHKDAYQFLMMNGLFVDEKVVLREGFKEIGTQAFGATIMPINFDTLDLSLIPINNWVKQSTDGKIREFLTPSDISPGTQMIIATAAYFEGLWLYPFTKKSFKAPFYPENDPPALLKMMRQKITIPYFDNDEVQGIKLPFIRKGAEQPALDCVIIVPHKDLSRLESQINAETLSNWVNQASSTYVEIQIPKFKIKQKLDLSAPLQALGITNAFSQEANFGNITGSKNLVLNKVLHETYFSFKKKGVTASSTTTSHVGLKAPVPYKQQPVLFLANRPFIFCIVESHTGAILFMGHIKNPTGLNGNHM